MREIKVLVFLQQFDVLEPSLQKWVNEGWRIVSTIAGDHGRITVIIEQ